MKDESLRLNLFLWKVWKLILVIWPFLEIFLFHFKTLWKSLRYQISLKFQVQFQIFLISYQSLCHEKISNRLIDFYDFSQSILVPYIIQSKIFPEENPINHTQFNPNKIYVGVCPSCRVISTQLKLKVWKSKQIINQRN